MKRLTHPQTLSGFFLLFLMLFSLAVSAAKLEVDRGELAIGEITTVHLKGAPFLAVVDWKVSPELEIVDSDKKRVRVRGLREGAGTVKCEMNLSVHSINVTVRRAAAVATEPVQAPLPAYTPPAYTPAASSAPTFTTPSYPTPTPASASPQSNLAGTWQINANGYPGKLELSSTQGMLSGRVWFDAHAAWEPLEDLYFDAAIGELSFSRPGANQAYRGRLQGNRLEGMFTQWGGRDYTASAPTYPWSATNAGAEPTKPATPAAARPVRISEFIWQGLGEDKVGDWGNGRPNGTPDGHLRLTLDLPDRQAISSISLWSANEKGDKAGGQVWHSKNGSYWMLGLFRDGRQINASHIASLGEFSGRIVFDLYANSSGWFNPGQTFLVEVETGDGQTARQTLRLGAAPPPAPQTTGGNQRLKLVDAIPSASSDQFRRNQRTDLTMHTSSWDRTPYFMAPPREFNLNLSRIERACLAGDAQGKNNWRVDNFLLFELFDSSGTPLGAGVVGGHEGVSQNGRRLPELGPVSFDHGPCAVDLKAFLPQGRPFRLKVSAMDYGGVGDVSDVWLLLDAQGGTAGQSNLARGKPASQSSTSQWSRANDAQGAVDGVISGSYSFHTEHQANPWWQVDLGTVYRLSEVRLYNRLDCCSERARTVQVMLSDDGRNWRTVYRHNGSLFGGKDGKPLLVSLSGEQARHVRLQLNESNWFHLDEVEIFGVGEAQPIGGGRDYSGYTMQPVNGGSVNASSLAGTWSINANSYTGKLELSESGGRPNGQLSGRVWFDAHRVWEDLRDFSFDGRTLRFLRPGPSQHYTGTLSGNEVRGTFDQGGGGSWNWVITRQSTVPAVSGGANLARGKPASQSSTSQWSRANDAQGAVDGVINGSYSFHTEHQANPWWQVDLGTVYRLSEVRLYNRLDCCSERARTVQVMLSDDGRNWRTVYRHNGSLFGGKDGKPLLVALGSEAARYVRLQLNEANWFHLDEVEVMGGTEGGRGYTAQPPSSGQSAAPSTDDSLKDVVNQLKGIFKR